MLRDYRNMILKHEKTNFLVFKPERKQKYTGNERCNKKSWLEGNIISSVCHVI